MKAKVLNKLKQIRWERNLSTRDVEKLTGITNGMISQIENGHSYPTQLSMLLIARGLELRVDEIFILDTDCL
jgi:transcriptional regulator with XRE-family HTH domain